MAPELKVNKSDVADETGGEEEIDELEGSEHHSAYGEDSDGEPVPKARKPKRARSSVAKPKAPRKKYVRGKQGGLEGIMKMPLEIFTEIASYIAPGDLIALIQCSKFFRTMLLRRSAILIWQRAAENVPGLPPCPTGMYEPQYAALMFSRHCTLCGATATAKPDPHLQVKLCPTCRETKLVAANNQTYLVSRSYAFKLKCDGLNDAFYGHSLKHDLEEVRQKSEELFKNQDAYCKWAVERGKALIQRSKEATVLEEYIVLSSKSREQELANAKRERRDMVRERLVALGWTDADQRILYNAKAAKSWSTLVDIPKPLTDRTWTNLLAKLTPLLEENRVYRLAREKKQRRIDRRGRLYNLIVDISDNVHPFSAAIEVLAPGQGAGVTSTPQSSDSHLAPKPGQRLNVANPFPQTAIAFEWECLKDLGETEISLERVEELFNERREQIDRYILDWREDLEEQLVEIFHAGVATAVQGALVEEDESVEAFDGEESIAEPIVKVKDSTDSTKDLSRNTRLLLRADTIFRVNLLGSNQHNDNSLFHGGGTDVSTPCYYPGIISEYDSFHEYMEFEFPPPPPVNVNIYLRHTEAENIVKKMLAEMQMPDVAYMELDAMKRRFVCGRCTEKKPTTWDGLVIHYMQRQRQWNKNLNATSGGPIQHPVVFRNVHDVEWTTNPKPLVRILTEEESSQRAPRLFDYSNLVRCMLCTGTGRDFSDYVPDVVAHIQDVHDIAEPTEGLYYKSTRGASAVTDILGDKWRQEWDEFHDARAEWA
ncbi:hypothetical protein BDV93DRAFT_527545 [Ceratobasidium sp. AG-I]|nr:hypothetical protein BDV93DRAFT_527545 [Ceratobasidium sp. AG-I]